MTAPVPPQILAATAQLLRDGTQAGEVAERVRAEVPGISDDDALDVAVRAADLAPWLDAPRLPGPPDPGPLPPDALPPVLRAHVASVAGATQTPPCMGAMLALAAVSAALRGRVDIMVDPRRDWRELAVLYTCVILPPATRKSPVYRHMVQAIEDWERHVCARIASEYRLAMDRVARAEHDLRAAIGRKRGALGLEDARIELDAAEAAVPVLPRVLASDATPEALVRVMAEGGGSIALLSAEADPLGIADGRYSDIARVDELLRAWSGEAIRVDRIGREPIHVPRPALTLGITVQPAALDALRHGRVHRGRGLWGRILWCCPPHGLGSRLTGRDVPPLDVDAAKRYGHVLLALLDATATAKAQELALSADALDILDGYEAELERELADGGRLAPVRDHAGKIVGQAVRLAALIELAARAEHGRPLWSEPICRWAMDAGVRLARALTTHAMAVLAPALDDRAADMAYVLRRVRESPEGSTVRDVYRAVDRHPSIAEAETPSDYLAELLDALVERGCIRLVPQPSTGGRPPSPVVELHPDLRATSVPTVPVDVEVML